MKPYIRHLLLLIFCFLFISCSTNKSKTKAKTIQVSIDKNSETLFILYSLLDFGLPPRKHSLWEKVELKFKDFKKHKVVALADTLTSRSGLDSPVKLMKSFSQLPNIKQNYPIENKLLRVISGSDDVQAGQEFVDELILQLSDFYRTAKIDLFFKENNAYYEKAINDIKKNLPSDDFIFMMEEYYGKENLQYTLNPSPALFPGFGFGSRLKTDKGLLVFNTFAPLNENENGEILFDFDNYSKIRELSVHEFGHSFVNTILELPENEKRINQYAYLFNPIEKVMSKGGYRSWMVCAIEHIVRLGEIRIALTMNDSITAAKLRKNYIEERKFIYLPYLENKIMKYESDRDKYPSFSDFIPELINTFSEIDTTQTKL